MRLRFAVVSWTLEFLKAWAPEFFESCSVKIVFLACDRTVWDRSSEMFCSDLIHLWRHEVRYSGMRWTRQARDCFELRVDFGVECGWVMELVSDTCVALANSKVRRQAELDARRTRMVGSLPSHPSHPSHQLTQHLSLSLYIYIFIYIHLSGSCVWKMILRFCFCALLFGGGVRVYYFISTFIIL